MSNFKVFTRTWYRKNTNYPGGLEPHPGRKTTLGYATTTEKARAMCKEYNDNNKPGPLSRKAEFTSDY